MKSSPAGSGTCASLTPGVSEVIRCASVTGPAGSFMVHSTRAGALIFYPVIRYSESLQFGYRWFQKQGIKPMFGFGLACHLPLSTSTT
jgi:hypothetical protein